MKNLIHSYLDHSFWNLKENSNFQYNYHSLRNYIASDIIKTYWLENVFSEKECDRHLSGDFHIHDLDNLCPYCICRTKHTFCEKHRVSHIGLEKMKNRA